MKSHSAAVIVLIFVKEGLDVVFTEMSEVENKLVQGSLVAHSE